MLANRWGGGYAAIMSRANGRAARTIAGPFTIKVRVRGRLITLRLTPDLEAGGYCVSSPTLRGLNTQGESIDDAVANGCEAALALLTETAARRHA